MKTISLLALGLLLAISSFSQNNNLKLISPAGDHYTNDSYQLDWSIGELVTATLSSNTFTLTQGFHQNSYVITSIESHSIDGVNLNIFPNPTSEFLTISNLDKLQQKGHLKITDENGKVLFSKEVSDMPNSIDVSAFASGVYFLSISTEQKVINTFKIIKL